MSIDPQGVTRVLACFGRQVLLRLPDGAEDTARLPDRRTQLVAGDLVRATWDSAHREWRVDELLPRTGAVYRSNLRGRAELIASGLRQLLVVLAPVPKPDFYLMDRYLAAAVSAALSPAIVLNKCELADSDPWRTALRDECASLKIELLECSAASAQGLEALQQRLAMGPAMLVGQSGVGKSSLLRALLPDLEARIGSLDNALEGRHTTTVTRWYSAERHSALVDSPGVRDFAPAPEHLRAGDLGFTDIGHFSSECRFADCRHWREPDCAVRAAADAGRCNPRRLESFRRLWRLREQLLKKQRGH